jgi:tetratricopeptide (TPR) repeat protein
LTGGVRDECCVRHAPELAHQREMKAVRGAGGSFTEGDAAGQEMIRMVPMPFRDARPYTRWWWFSGAIREDDVRAQLDWLRANGFGGVEIAWVYPQPDARPGAVWLSPEWSAIVACARRYAESIGLGCDFTFGTLWPFGGSIVGEADASRTFAGLSPQRLGRSWELPHSPPGYVLNHLDRRALERYAERMLAALGDALGGATPALFCDSWEVEGDDLWADGFARAFANRFGYDVIPFMGALDDHPDIRHDYRALLADVVLDEFYRPLAAICRAAGAASRVQCHGAPTDLLAAYAAVDVPETEAVLFDPPFSRIAASAAALAGRPIVSAEAFTCLYGWTPFPGPGAHQGQECVGDLKLVADALFANGVNAVVWHGMPFNPAGGANRFYASVHVGPDSAFADDLPTFNAYLERVSARLREGEPCADLAVYLPLEDNRMRGELPEAWRRPSARHCWELQHVRMPEEVAGYRPLWVSAPFLAEAGWDEGSLRIGPVRFRALYIDVEWLDAAALASVLRLAARGLPVCLKRRPQQPGHRRLDTYEADVDRLVALPNVVPDLADLAIGPPFLAGDDLPECWCRRVGDDHVIFFAHPASRTVTYPLRYGQSMCAETARWTGRACVGGREVALDLVFEAFQSLLVTIDGDGRVSCDAIDFRPSRRSIDRMVDHLLALAEAAEPHLTGPDQVEWLARIEACDAGLRAAVRWLLSDTGDALKAMRLTSALWRYWHMRGAWSDGLAYLRQALDRADPPAPPTLRCKALRGAASLAVSLGDADTARAFQEEVLAISRAAGDRAGIAAALSNLGSMAWTEGLFSVAKSLHGEGLAIRRDLGDRRGVAGSLLGLGNVASRQGHHAEARAHYAESLAIYRDLGDKASIAGALLNLGNTAFLQGDLDAARARYDESLSIARDLGDKRRIAFSLGNLGDIAHWQRDFGSAREYYQETVRTARELGDRPLTANALLNLGDLTCGEGDLAAARDLLGEGLALAREVGNRAHQADGIEGFARLAARGDRPRRAARLLGAADRLRRTIGAALPQVGVPSLEEAAAFARRALGDEGFDAAWVEGAMLWVDDAVAYALGESDPWLD